MASTTEDRLARIERNLLTLLRWSIDIMTTQQEFDAKMDAMVAAAADAKADAATQRAITDQAVGLLQGLTAAIADLRNQAQAGAVITQAQFDALAAKADAALADMAAANATRDQASLDLQAGVSGNTPAP